MADGRNDDRNPASTTCASANPRRGGDDGFGDFMERSTICKILASSGVGLFSVDLETGKSQVSPTWKTMLGIEPDADIEPQREWHARMHPDDLERLFERDAAFLAGQDSENRNTYRIRHADGHWVWIESNAHIIKRDDNGHPLVLAGTHTDVTAEQTIRRIAKETDQRNRLMLNHSPVGIAVFCPKARLQDCNALFAEMLGYAPNEVLGMSLMKLVWFDMDPDEVRRKQDFYNGKSKEITFETELLCKNGDRKHAMVRGVRFVNKEDEVRFLFQCSDITERVQAELQKDEFLATVSHELRTPLTSIAGVIRLANSGAIGEMSPKMKELMAVAERGCDTLLRLVNELLDFKSLEAGELSYYNEQFRVAEAVREAIGNMAGYLKPGQKVETDVSPRAEGVEIVADRGRFLQILTNLQSNASKISPPEACITIRVSLAPGWVRVSVQDRGPGVPKELEGRIFQRFAQANSSDKRSVQGTGLGLAISRRMTQDMKGQIGYFNNDDGGATFWVAFPAELD
ncbi:PAS domain-containing sensor histidine kinase [Shimia aestuarii]|uniref:histidine kinase n=1 Tax=Shimia aestuarii TaxID=254406 RepID=A0A1I4NDI1_9RHOB|nr:PAS domain-containing sensor histidine kinase [Shimia aestuarii]SFM13558.1 PAS domain S-box-containing protein [Shimia aestuarii]